jgi:hypothetical protein
MGRGLTADRAYVLVLAVLVVIDSLCWSTTATWGRSRRYRPAAVVVMERSRHVRRRPIPAEVKETASDSQTTKTEKHDLVPWASLERASLVTSTPPSTRPTSLSTEEVSKEPKPDSVSETNPEPALLALYERFTEEARLRSTILANQVLL